MKKAVKKMLNGLGIMLFILGVCAGDSENLLAPLILIVDGLAILSLTGFLREAAHYEDDRNEDL